MQLILISTLNLLVAIYTFYVRPYDVPSENIKNGVGEII